MLKVMHIISGDLWAGAEVQAYTLLSALKPHCDLCVVLMNEGRLARELTAVGITTAIIDERQHSPLGIVQHLRKLMKGYQPDVVHTHRQKENVLGALANKLTVRAACLRTVHGASEFQHRGLKRLQNSVDNWVGRHWQAGAIAVSHTLLDDLNNRFGPGKTVVIANGINEERLKAMARPLALVENHDDYHHIGLIGRLEPVKRVDVFLGMAQSMLDDQPNGKPLIFHVIGGGSLKSQLLEMARAMNMGERVVFHGHRDDIPSCILSLDAIVMCSDHEGSPMTVLEALALGKPVVAHKVGGMVEMLASYPECLVDDQRAVAFRQALLGLLRGQSKSDTVFSLDHHFSADFNAEQTMDLYMTLSSRSKH